MRRLMTGNVKKGWMARVCAAAFLVLIGLTGTAVHAAPQLWSIVVHFQYADGFEFDYVIDTGVPTSEIGAALAACGQSHVIGTVVRYHCYPVPE